MPSFRSRAPVVLALTVAGMFWAVPASASSATFSASTTTISGPLPYFLGNELTPPASENGYLFANATALSQDGNTLVVGEEGGDKGQYVGDPGGNVRVYTRSGYSFIPLAVIHPPPDWVPGDGFGGSVAVDADGGEILIGSSSHPNQADNYGPGAMYVYQRTGTGYVETQEIDDPYGHNDDGFGRALAVSPDGSTAITLGGGAGVDVLYMYTLSSSTFTLSTSLEPAPFAWDIALSSDGRTIAVGCTVFQLGGNGQYYLASQRNCGNQYYGMALSSDGNTLVTATAGGGAINEPGTLSVTSPVNPGNWFGPTTSEQLPEPTAVDGGWWHPSAVAVSSDGGTIVAGDPAANNGPGLAAVYVRASGYQLFQLIPGIAGSGCCDGYGTTVAIDGLGDVAAVGTYSREPGGAIDGFFRSTSGSATSVAVASSATATPAWSADPVQITAKVQGSSPTGYTTFWDGEPGGPSSVVIGSSALTKAGASSVTITTLSAGDHSLFAVYSGDQINAPSEGEVDVTIHPLDLHPGWTVSVVGTDGVAPGPVACAPETAHCIALVDSNTSPPTASRVLYTDNGVTWRSPYGESGLPGSDQPMYVTCPTAEVCWAAGRNGNNGIFAGFADKSTDGGVTWQNASPNQWAFTPTYGTGQGGLDCPSAQVCFIAGFYRSNPAIAETSDGGQTWDINAQLPTAPSSTTQAPGAAGATSEPDGYALTAISCVSDQRCVAVGQSYDVASPHAVALETADGGQSWYLSPSPLLDGLFALDDVSCIPSSSGGWCMASGATLSTSTGGAAVLSSDGGATWTSGTEFGAGAYVGQSIQFVSCSAVDTCWISVSQPMDHGLATTFAASTTDGGQSWLADGDTVARPLYGLACPTLQFCVATGRLYGNVDLLVTSNAGDAANVGSDGPTLAPPIFQALPQLSGNAVSVRTGTKTTLVGRDQTARLNVPVRVSTTGGLVRNGPTPFVGTSGFFSTAVTARRPGKAVVSFKIKKKAMPPIHITAYRRPAPVVESVSPPTAAPSGGTIVTVHGSGFANVTAVMVGRSSGSRLRVISSKELRFTAPRGFAVRDVVVITGLGGPSPVSDGDHLTYSSSTR
jgi:hypothetical protein